MPAAVGLREDWDAAQVPVLADIQWHGKPRKVMLWANRNGVKTFGCTGFSGGKLKTLAQRGLHVPLDDMGIVESIHLTAFHWVVGNLHKRISLDEMDNRHAP